MSRAKADAKHHLEHLTAAPAHVFGLVYVVNLRSRRTYRHRFRYLRRQPSIYRVSSNCRVRYIHLWRRHISRRGYIRHGNQPGPECSQKCSDSSVLPGRDHWQHHPHRVVSKVIGQCRGRQEYEERAPTEAQTQPRTRYPNTRNIIDGNTSIRRWDGYRCTDLQSPRAFSTKYTGPTSILRPQENTGKALRLLVGASGTAITSRYSESERQQGGHYGLPVQD